MNIKIFHSAVEAETGQFVWFQFTPSNLDSFIINGGPKNRLFPSSCQPDVGKTVKQNKYEWKQKE